MAGWNLTNGIILDYNVSEEKYWSLFNYVFSGGSRKRNTYKFGLIKAFLDNLFDSKEQEKGYYFTYKQLFGKFAENYWNLVIKYNLRQMRKDGKSEFSKVEVILNRAVAENQMLSYLEFENIDKSTKESIIRKVTSECKKCVIGALYEDFDGLLFGFELKEQGLHLAPKAYDFMLKYKAEIENLNYYAWAKFLEKVNEDNVLIKVIDKLELATPKRSDLSIYRDILQKEFEECNCFYCGKKLKRVIHVDHFIPWSFVKDDKIWNFVLSCSKCNQRKSNRVASKNYVVKINNRNKILQQSDNSLINIEFENYTPELIGRMWEYAQLSGIKEYKTIDMLL